METRKITIISTKNNKRTVINTNATTLGELKRALREAGIDYNDMTFYEGLTKTELKFDESLLPHDVQRINPITKEPETTNELAFMLTNANKKIKSGAMSRTEAYAAIKENNLGEKCIQIFGKNFTMCKTADLISLIESTVGAKKPAVSKPAPSDKPTAVVDAQATEAIRRLVHLLYQQNIIEKEDLEYVLDAFGKTSFEGPDSPYTDDELNDMFKGMC